MKRNYLFDQYEMSTNRFDTAAFRSDILGGQGAEIYQPRVQAVSFLNYYEPYLGKVRLG